MHFFWACSAYDAIFFDVIFIMQFFWLELYADLSTIQQSFYNVPSSGMRLFLEKPMVKS